MNQRFPDQITTPALPLQGVVVLEFGHTILGPCCGLLLADLGAEVIKIEPEGGDRTRSLKGFGAGYFGFFNRNKKSITLDFKTPEGKRHAEALIARADVIIENMAPGVMVRAGLGPADVSRFNPRAIYCSLKGFLSGPYGSRVALDEVVQMMSGLAYMTGPPGKPLRAGASITDILAGVFGAFGILAALRLRDQTGQGSLVESALFETAAFMMGQHMALNVMSGEPVPPMPARVSAWAVYDLFESLDRRQVFLGITSDKHWESFCREFDLDALLEVPEFSTNALRIEGRPRIIADISRILKLLTLEEILERCEKAGVPFSPVGRPEDLFEDPHLNQNGSLAATVFPTDLRTKLPKLPLRINGNAFELRLQPPSAGEHSGEILKNLHSVSDAGGLK